jgi:hypothetical protein
VQSSRTQPARYGPAWKNMIPELQKTTRFKGGHDMKLRNAILPLAVLALTAACGDGSGGTRDPAPSAGGTFRIEISGADSRTLTHTTARSIVSRIEPDDPPAISFRILEPDGDGYMLYQLMLELRDVQPGDYVFDYETDEFGYRVDESERPPLISYTVMEADANRAMVMGGRGDMYSWGQSGTLTLHSVNNDRVDGEFDVTVYNRRTPGPERVSIRAVGEFSGISIARR